MQWRSVVNPGLILAMEKDVETTVAGDKTRWVEEGLRHRRVTDIPS